MDYYKNKLCAEKLKQCYDIAPERVKQYLEAEIDYVIKKIHAGDRVLELGCGYGRVLNVLAKKAGFAAGIDSSLESLKFGQSLYGNIANCLFLQMDAAGLAFIDHSFDVVVCIQNGISSFHIDQNQLLRESIRVTKPGGTVLFSSYSDKFWIPRLEWFKLQSEAGLLGEIDHERTQNGVIICKDGFTASTVDAESFLSLAAEMNVAPKITEVDDSSLFCEIYV